MACFIISHYDVTDPDKYQQYVAAVIPTLLKHGAEVLVADNMAKPLEGNPAHVHVVLKFPDDAAANAWYNDPDYLQIKPLRVEATDNTSMIIAEEFSLAH